MARKMVQLERENDKEKDTVGRDMGRVGKRRIERGARKERDE